MNDGGWIYANSKLAAAMELARRPDAVNNPSLQDEICRNYGIFLENMTDDEFEEFENIVKDAASRHFN